MPDLLISRNFVPNSQLGWSEVLAEIQTLTRRYGPSDPINFVRKKSWSVGEFVDMTDGELVGSGMSQTAITRLTAAIVLANLHLSESSP